MTDLFAPEKRLDRKWPKPVLDSAKELIDIVLNAETQAEIDDAADWLHQTFTIGGKTVYPDSNSHDAYG